MIKPKLWLCGLTGPNKENDLREAIEPIYDFFTGLVWVFHYPKDSGADYLESRKKDGKIIYADWVNRHDFMRNHYLYYGPIQEGDWWIDLDSHEFLLPSFFVKLNFLFDVSYQNNIDGWCLDGKRFMFRFNDFMFYRGNPHEGVSGTSRTCELTKLIGFEKKDSYFLNLRDEKRPLLSYIDQWAKYYYCYPDSNHCFLGYEKAQEQQLQAMQQRDVRRRQFRFACKALGLEYSLNSLKEYFLKTPIEELNPFIRESLNEEKLLNDFYAYHILKKTKFVNPGESWWKDMEKI